MSYLSSSLGSSIPRYAILAGIALTILVVTSALWNVNNLDSQATYLATEEARSNWDKDQAFRRWATRHGGLYVRPDERTPPNPYLEHLPYRDVVTTDGMELTLMNPAYMMSQMAREFESLYGIKGKITGQILLNPKNQADPWELNALKQFDKGVAEVLEQTSIDGQPYLRLMRPMVMTEGCVLCHGHLDFKVGDIRGGVSISVPLAPYIGAARRSKTTLLATHGAVWSIGMLAIGFVSWRGQKREFERKISEKTLQDSEERFRTAIVSAPIPIMLHAEDGEVISVNRRWTELTGYTHEDIPTINAWTEKAYGGKPRQVKEIFNKLYRIDAPHSDGEFEITTSTGVQLSWLFHSSPLGSDQDGRSIIISTALDITEHKQAQEALRASEARLKEIFAIAPEAVITVSSDMIIELFNQGAERIFGYEAEEVLGKSLNMLMPEGLREGHGKHVEEFESSGDTYRLMDQRREITGLGKDGAEFPASASVSKLQIGGEKIYTVMLQDITERKNAQDTLMAALNEAKTATLAKSAFLAAMSHDLRTPLNAIIGFAEILSQQYFGPINDKYREYAGDIHSSGEHLMTLVNDILDLSTIEAGKRSLNKERLSVLEIVTECEKIIETRVRSLGIDMTTKIAENLPPLFVDKRAAKQILLNLLQNAVKFTPEGGKITVSAKASKKYTTLKIEDTGKGIPAEDIPRLTDPFTKEEADPYLAEQGWGLGLSITKSLIDLHNGKLDIKSKVGKGTTVTVSFPNEAS